MWKYAQVKVRDAADTAERTDAYQVFEVYDLDDNGEYESFSGPSLIDLESLKMAVEDIERDGINTWFYENGVFKWKQEENNCWGWDWMPNEAKDE
jgi:hypothetical protein